MSDWISQAGAIVGIVVAIGAIVAYLRASADKGTIGSLKEYAEASDKRITQLEQTEVRLTAEAKLAAVAYKAEIDKLTARIDVLEADKAVLLQQRPSAEAIAELTGMVKQHDSDMKRLLSEART